MREHVHSASLRRDQRLAQVRNLTLWIGGGAAAASLALGTVFAHSIPGHAASTSTSGSGGASGGQPATGGTAHSGQTAPASQAHGRHRHHHRLAPPASAPASKPAPAPAPPPVVTSGGS